MPAFVDHTGRSYGRWTVIQRAENNRHNQPRWLCRCECGNEKVVPAGALVSGASRSCGCLSQEMGRRVCVERNTTHGRAKTPTYRIWSGMITRCHNPRASGFHKYGARGVTVCDRWRHSFEAFLADMGEKPPGLTLDRIDSREGYEPSNCRWATMREQQNNRTNNRRITYGGETLTLAQWARRLGMPPSTLQRRADAGLPISDARS